MKISVCIPHYNRVEYLLESLNEIKKQTYRSVEVVIGDDASTDDSQTLIPGYLKDFPFENQYIRHIDNIGYDANLRSTLLAATGDYCFILGNDDTFVTRDDLANLRLLLQAYDMPDVGLCNFVEAVSEGQVVYRVAATGVLGSGPDIALNYAKSFSFVAGIIIKRSKFLEVNTDKLDGSIYVQMYLCTRIIAHGGAFFTIATPMVKKDLVINGRRANSYRDHLVRSIWKIRAEDGGLPQVAKVIFEAFLDEGLDAQMAAYSIVQRIYSSSYPFWLLDYRRNGSYYSALGLCLGLQPDKFSGITFTWRQKWNLQFRYLMFSAIGLLTPVWLFNKLQNRIYAYLKK